MRVGNYEVNIGFCDNLAGSMMGGIIIEKGNDFRFIPTTMFILVPLILVVIFYV